MNLPLSKYTLFLALQNLFLLLCVTVGCNSKQLTTTPSGTGTGGSSGQMLFITLEALKDTITGTVQIKIIQQQLVNGSVNAAGFTNTPAQDDNPIAMGWKISLLTQKEKTIAYLAIPNPFVRELEYADENGQFKRKTIRLTRAEIPLRFNYNTNIKKIKVDETITNQSIKTLYRSTLSL